MKISSKKKMKIKVKKRVEVYLIDVCMAIELSQDGIFVSVHDLVELWSPDWETVVVP